MSFTSIDFRKTLSQFATGVAIAITKDDENHLYGVTVNSLTSVSLEPPMILFCLKKISLNAMIFQRNKQLTFNVLASDQENLARKFASHAEKNWDLAGLFTHENGLPALKGCSAHLFCEVESVIEGGDHLIFLCKVKGLAYDPSKKPLIFHQSQFCTTYVLDSLERESA